MQPNRSAISTLVWRDWRKPQRISVNIADALVEMLRIRFRLVSLNVDCFSFKSLYHIVLPVISFYAQTTNKLNELQNTQLGILCSALWSLLSSLLFLRVEYTINRAKKKKCLLILKSTFKNVQVLKFWSCSVAIYYIIVTFTNKHVRWQCLLRTLSLLSSRGGPMPRSQIQSRRLPTKKAIRYDIFNRNWVATRWQ